MSTNDPVDLKQDRRQWLKTSATFLGAAALPMSGAVPEASRAESQTAQSVNGASPAAAAEGTSSARFFTPAQHAMVEELSETIIPADSHSGGAKAAKVAEYIEQTLRKSTDESKKALWHECLPLIDSMSQHYNGKSFVNAGPEERIAVLTVLSDNHEMTDVPEVRFFHELKKMTVEGYYTTKIGIHDELEYKGN